MLNTLKMQLNYFMKGTLIFLCSNLQSETGFILVYSYSDELYKASKISHANRCQWCVSSSPKFMIPKCLLPTIFNNGTNSLLEYV